MSWQLVGKHIAIVEDGKIAHLEAADVYLASKNKGFEFGGKEQGEIEAALPDISFSPLSKNAEIDIYHDKNQIEINVHVGNTDVEFIKGRALDQIIIDGVWFYISNMEELNELFEELSIRNNGIIDIRQYLELLKRNFKENLLRDHMTDGNVLVDLSYEKPSNLSAELYEYQQKGFMWLDFMLDNCSGCILGDEMGLGKTFQAIALIQKRANHNKKSLVVAPVSLLDNWENECVKFAPSVKVLIHHGASRTGSPMGFEPYDLVVTSYGHLVTDNLLFSMCDWDLMILDEAQNIKNPSSARTKNVKNIMAKARLAVTGTPFENHVLVVWSLLDFIMPSSFGAQKDFTELISDDIEGAKKLEPILSSVMVRRMVNDVAKDLLEKVIVAQPMSMSDLEIDEYENIRKELSGTQNATLPMLQKLRMFCTHPKLIDELPVENVFKNSIKYQRTCEILEEIFSRNEKVIIFTSYQKMFDIFCEDIPNRFKVKVDCINGSTPVPERQKIVDWFNGLEQSAVLILNPRAAGTGLNITSANHVIHYNLEWNPALEDQASARAYRRGQTKTTFIYRLYYKGTVEEIINQRLDRKREMASNAVIGADGSEADMQDIIDSLNISPIGGSL